jgi:spore germination protein KB
MFTGIFGVAVGREKVLPFFELTRLIYLNRFLQRVETVFIVLWVIFGMAAIAIDLYITIYLLTRLFHLSSMRPLILPLAVVVSQLSMMPPDSATTIELYVKADALISTPGLFAIPVILLLATLIKGKWKAKPCTANQSS